MTKYRKCHRGKRCNIINAIRAALEDAPASLTAEELARLAQLNKNAGYDKSVQRRKPQHIPPARIGFTGDPSVLVAKGGETWLDWSFRVAVWRHLPGSSQHVY